jgi:hypothetical protein
VTTASHKHLEETFEAAEVEMPGRDDDLVAA